MRDPGAHRLRVFDVSRAGEALQLTERPPTTDLPRDLAALSPSATADALLLVGDDLAVPAPELVAELLRGPAHVWHGGLRLGQGDRPAAWNACHSRAMFSRDADDSIESTSWRLSARALLVRTEVLRTFGGFDPSFDTPAGAALEAGLRWITHGALIRHVPRLVPPGATSPPDAPPSPADGIRLVRKQMGTSWAGWSIARGLQTGSIRVRNLTSVAQVIREPAMVRPATFGLIDAVAPPPEAEAQVTVLVPTIGRNDYLEKLLVQLASQTRPPDEVVVVDQNPADERLGLADLFPGLPLQVVHLEPPGQCTARNLGLAASTGSHILFLDDDDEIPADLIEQHLAVLAHPEVAASCGLVDDRESGPAPASERFRKASAVFPTNNTMIRRSILDKTGLFDPTYDRGARADHDLGMRSYLTGHLHVHDPRPQVFHHHAPMGGLRTHGARVRTRGNSRNTLTERHLKTPTDVYLGLRYYPPERVDEDLVLSVFATLRGDGSRAKRVLRLLVQAALLPSTWANAKRVRGEGARLLRDRPPLPTLSDPLA